MFKPTNDLGDLYLFAPFELHSQNDLRYSYRWIYEDPVDSSVYKMMKKAAEQNFTGEEAL